MTYNIQSASIDGLPGVLVYLGLGHPVQRAVTAGAVVAGIQYIVKKPVGAFDETGSIRPHRMFSVSPKATEAHFLMYPVAVATAIYLFT
tara:strand:- start:578 stop:844 length:267 start_codon:yes stop_codon:yes gene_type:complete